MLKELGLVFTGVVIGSAATLYLTRELLGGAIADRLINAMDEIIDEEVQDAKDEIHNEQVEKDNKRDYTKPLRKSGKYPWGKESKSFLVAVLATREEAEKVLAELHEHIDLYGYATISDYYELVEIESNYEDHQYGWTSMNDAFVVPRKQGFAIKLPIAKVLNK